MEKRTIEERVAEQEKKLENAMLRVQQYKEQLTALENRKADEERKQRTHMHILCGAELSALFEHTLTEDEIHIVVNHLRDEMNRGIFRLEKKEMPVQEMTRVPLQEVKKEEDEFGDAFGLFNF